MAEHTQIWKYIQFADWFPYKRTQIDLLFWWGTAEDCWESHAGEAGGIEAAVHAMGDIFNEESTDALLRVDADKTFNTLNRRVLLHNIKYLCPPMAVYITNCYSVPYRPFLFLEDLEFIVRRDHTGESPRNASICHWHNHPVEDNQTWNSKGNNKETCSLWRWPGWYRWTAGTATLVG